MNCHDDKNGKHNGMKHILHMILCCGLPVVILLLIPFIARISPSFAGVLGVIAPFLCPVMMIGMVLMMSLGRNRSGGCHSSQSEAAVGSQKEEI